MRGCLSCRAAAVRASLKTFGTRHPTWSLPGARFKNVGMNVLYESSVIHAAGMTVPAGICRSNAGIVHLIPPLDMAARASDPLICACFLLLLSLFNCSVVASRGPDTMGSQAPSPLEENGGVGSAEAPAPSAGPGLVDYQAMIKATQQLGLPRLEAYLRRVSGILDSSGKSTVGPASAPEAATSVEAPTQQRNEAIPPVSDSNEGGSKPPSFQGKPFIRTRADTMLYTRQMQDAKKAKAEGKAAPLVFPIIYLDQLEQLDDKEAGAIFHLGTAEIPSSISKSTPSMLACLSAVSLMSRIHL